MSGQRVMPYRRKRQGRTDYKKRLNLLKSGLPRLVVRTSNKNTHLQLIEYLPDGDKVIATARASELPAHGWKGNAGNMPSAYLAGVLLAKKAAVKGDVIADIGLQKHHKGGRLYAAIKGAIDGGLSVRASQDVLPTEERVKGVHISEDMAAAVEATKSTILK